MSKQKKFESLLYYLTVEVKFKGRGSAITSKSKILELNAVVGSFQQQQLW